jgi:hypothetical protein
MLFEAGSWKGPLVIATISGSVFSGLLQALDPSTSATTVITGVLSGVIILLFGMFIRQGNKLAALDAYAKRNKDDINKLDGESRTVDKRIELSRHAWKNEISPQILNVEDRVMVRVDENTRALVRLEERFNRHLEGGV